MSKKPHTKYDLSDSEIEEKVNRQMNHFQSKARQLLINMRYGSGVSYKMLPKTDQYGIDQAQQDLNSLLVETVGKDEKPDTFKRAGVYANGKYKYIPDYSLRAQFINQTIQKIRTALDLTEGDGK